MSEKILVTGGTGFLGYNLLKKLSKLNYKLSSLSTNKPKKEKKISNVNYIICDVANKIKLRNKIKKDYDYIVNFSGYVDHQKKTKTIKSHFNGCKNLVDHFKNSNIKNFIQIGSSMEYGVVKSPHKENTVCQPKGNYALAKYKASTYLKKIHKNLNFPFTIFRLYQIYGPHQSINRLIPIVINSCLKNKSFACTSGQQIRDFLYVEDLSNLIIKSIKRKARNKIYNVGSGKKIKVKDIIKNINTFIELGKPIYGKIKMRPEEALDNYPNISKVKKDFNWQPKVKLKVGLKRTIKFYEKKK